MNDPQQLLHVYPLDAKTKEGNLFWSLPKRPPTALEFDPKNPLHASLVAAIACLRAKNYKIAIPFDKPRSDTAKLEMAK